MDNFFKSFNYKLRDMKDVYIRRMYIFFYNKEKIDSPKITIKNAIQKQIIKVK